MLDLIQAFSPGAFLGLDKECCRLGPNFNVIYKSTLEIFTKMPCLREEEEDKS